MGRRSIYIFSNGNELVFDDGRFDGWCIYLEKPGEIREAPKDSEYFSRFLEVSKKYNQVYKDFVEIYNDTTKEIDHKVIEKIERLSLNYGEYSEQILLDFLTIYAGMIAEENKESAILKKRIKRLGMYQVLVERVNPLEAAKYSKTNRYEPEGEFISQIVKDAALTRWKTEIISQIIKEYDITAGPNYEENLMKTSPYVLLSLVCKRRGF